jgi:hypothetical protein
MHKNCSELVESVRNLEFSDYGYFWLAVSERQTGWRMEAMMPDAISSGAVVQALAKLWPGRKYHRVRVDMDGTWHICESA